MIIIKNCNVNKEQVENGMIMAAWNDLHKKTFKALLYELGSAFSILKSHYEETVYFLPLSPQGFLVLISSTVEG